jgi:prepilin-type N-terminal cleavage/methylation domain-containing protein
MVVAEMGRISKHIVLGQSGFTLVEIIAVLVILSVLAAVAVPRFIDMEENANQRALDAAIGELNGRENLYWAQSKISGSGYDSGTGDNKVWENMKTDPGGNFPDLGQDYKWLVGPVQEGAGSTLQFGQGVAQLERVKSTTTRPAKWARISP